MWPKSQFYADLVAFTEEILNGKLHFLCIVRIFTRKAPSYMFDRVLNTPLRMEKKQDY